MSEIKKLTDDMLESISGGTNSEMYDLQKKLNAANLSDIMNGLKEKGIKAKLSSKKDNEYEDLKTQKPLSHSEVMNRLK